MSIGEFAKVTRYAGIIAGVVAMTVVVAAGGHPGWLVALAVGTAVLIGFGLAGRRS